MRALHVKSLVLAALASAPFSAPTTGGGPADEPFVRVERFVFDAPEAPADGASGAPGASAVPSAVVRLDARGGGGKLELESDHVFARENRARNPVRVMAVEELRRERAELTWREVSPGAGRSLHAEWREREDALDVVEWGNGPRLRERLWSDDGALLPLYLLELLRQGRLTSGSVPCFEPLSRAIERYDVRTSYAGGASDGRAADAVLGERTVELVRTDGSLAGRYRFRGTRLTGFQLREGGAWARAVDEAEYERARELLEPGSSSAEPPRSTRPARAAHAIDAAPDR